MHTVILALGTFHPKLCAGFVHFLPGLCVIWDSLEAACETGSEDPAPGFVLASANACRTAGSSDRSLSNCVQQTCKLKQWKVRSDIGNDPEEGVHIPDCHRLAVPTSSMLKAIASMVSSSISSSSMLLAAANEGRWQNTILQVHNACLRKMSPAMADAPRGLA